MKPETKQIRKSTKTLRQLQREHKAAVEKMGVARQRLTKRKRQVHKLEVHMAEIENRIHGLNTAEGQTPSVAAKTLRPIRLIFNPKSGGPNGQKDHSLEKVVAALRAHGLNPEVFLKTSGKIAREYAREAVAEKEELVVVAGGDGTIEEVATQLVGSQTTLGILPIGTMNNLARSLGIPLDLEQACALLSTGITRQIDVGRIRADEKSHVEYFLETGGTGLTLIWPAGQSIKKRRWGKLFDQFSKIFRHTEAETEIELDDGQKIKTNGGMVTVSNAPLFGVNNLIAPEAKMDDGLFEVGVYDNMTKVELSSYFIKTTNGKRAYDPNVRFYKARWVKLSCVQPFSSVSDKDELIDRKDLKIELVPGALTMIVGQGAALTWPVDAVTAAPPLSGAQTAPKNGHTAPTETPTETAPAEIVVHSHA